MEGWITIHRRLLDSPLWVDEVFTRGQAWVDLIGLANYKPGFIRVRGNRIDVERGQCGWSIKRLSDRWRWSQGKVKRFFNELENDEQIEQQNSFVSSLITIVNYEEYQKVDSKTESRRGADGEQTGTKNKGNKGNNSKKESEKEKLSRVKNQYVEWHKESNNIDYKKFLSWFSHEWDDLEILLLKDGQIDEGKYGKLLGIFQGKGVLQPGEIIKTKIIGMAGHKGTPTKKSFYLTIANWLRDDMEKKK